MTVDDVFQRLRNLEAGLYVEDGQLKYAGPVLDSNDPLRAGIAEHRQLLTELFTYAPGGRCVYEDCYRLLAPNDKVACPDHRRQLDAVPGPWKQAEHDK